MTTAAIIVAAGRGLRAGGDVPKQWRMLGDRSVAEHALRTFGDHPRIDRLVMVLHPDDIAGKSWPLYPNVDIVAGGDTRAASVLAGLEAIEGAAEFVLIHDVARPLVSASLIDRVLDALARMPCAAPALPMTDALWGGKDGQVTGSVDRTGLFRAQTPQGFRLADILAAHRSHQGAALDDVEVARAFGLAVAIVEGEERNMKITTPDDFARAERYLEQAMDIRTGSGFDVHAFGPGTHVTLCGVAVPHDRGLVGHSDADVGLHAATDAIYGAMAAGDIGRHFPPSDPQWKGAASETFLRHAVELAATRGYRIGNVDVTLICEHPKIGPHAAEMQGQMSRMMGIDQARISVKATTTERLGFTGREEGIAAMATVTLLQP